MNKIPGLFDDNTTARIERINRLYDIYDGKQEWQINTRDYTPTIKITNWIRKLIDKKARFLFGNELFFNFFNDDEREDFFRKILEANRFHEKLLKALRDLLIGGNVALRIFADKDGGIKLLFSPAQEFLITHSIEDIDHIEKAVFFYWIKDDNDLSEQRIKRQTWELIDGKCVLDERTFNGYGEVISVEYDNYRNGLDFIPVILFQNELLQCSLGFRMKLLSQFLKERYIKTEKHFQREFGTQSIRQTEILKQLLQRICF